MKKNPWIACCLSLFIFPGAGHVYMGQKKAGYLIGLLCAALLGGVLILFELDLIRQIKQMPNPWVALSIKETLIKNSWARDKYVYIVGLTGISLLWLGSAVDVFRKK